MTTFQTIIMSQVPLCDVMMSIVYRCCHDTDVDILPSLTTCKKKIVCGAGNLG